MIQTTWDVNLQGVSVSLVDVTSRVLGLDVRQNVELGRMTSMVASVELNNDDGGLTPAEGGGTGDYSAVDWFSVGIKIFATFSGSVSTEQAIVFDGVVQEFSSVDDGTNSRVVITAFDGISVAGGLPPDAVTISVPATGPVDAMLEKLGDTIDTFQPFPLIYSGVTEAELVVERLDDSKGPDGDYSMTSLISGTVLDVISNNVLPAGPSVAWAGIRQVNSTTVEYTIYCIDRGLLRDEDNRILFEFDEGPGDPAVTSDVIVFDEITVNYSDDDLFNYAQIASGSVGGVTATASNAESVASYGMRAISASSTVNRTTIDAGHAAGSWSNRYSVHRFVPRSISFSTAVIQAHGFKGSEVKLAELFDVRYGLWQPCEVTYTPTGGSEITAECLLVGRRFRGRPGFVAVELELNPLVDFSSFTLDSDLLGVLDQNRLG